VLEQSIIYNYNYREKNAKLQLKTLIKTLIIENKFAKIFQNKVDRIREE